MEDSKIIELEKRVSLLEGWKEGHGEVLESIRRDMDDLKVRVTQLDQKIFALDQKMDKKFSEVDKKIFALDQKIFALDQKMTRFFMWTIGIQFGIFTSIVILLIGMLIKIH